MNKNDQPQATKSTLSISFDNSFVRELEGFYTPCAPAPAPAPKLLRLNDELAQELGLSEALSGPEGLSFLSGRSMPGGAEPVAQAYAGHQFGGFSPQLGDGRALLLGEVLDRNGKRRDIAFKGSGRTPFSRGGDGKAALGPVLREYIIGEAMHALRIPTTRALAAVLTGEPVFRETTLPGALLTRVASSHIRVGTFQFFAARKDTEAVQRLADYVIARHYPQLKAHPEPYLGLLKAVCERQTSLIARWMGVGFIHGVMNTDNVAISGETIDYGPCAFMESYSPSTFFSSIDRGGRYAYGNQPVIIQWNLARLAETLLPLLHSSLEHAAELATEVIEGVGAQYEKHWLNIFQVKLGLARPSKELANDFLELLEGHTVDFTLAFRRLFDAARGPDEPLLQLFEEREVLLPWLARWRLHSSDEVFPKRVEAMKMANPLYIARNHQVEAALSAATQGDLSRFERLLSVVKAPFEERMSNREYESPAPRQVTAQYQTFCGT
jgi:serine/tyrosine/threonine adenylyltransferase